jgi:hypothetical protein
MDFGKSFVFMFQDPHWFRKLLIGTLLVLLGIPLAVILIGLIPLIIVLGWTQVTLRNVLEGQEHPMPEWQDWGDFLVRGLKLFVAMLIWLLPIFILTVPIVMGSALLDNQNSASAAGVGGGVLIACASCLMLLWGIFVALISPAIYVRLAAFDRFSAAFEIGELWAFTRDNLGNVILVLLLLLLVSGIVVPIIGLLGGFVFCVGLLISIPFSSVWQYLVTAHLYGQIGAYGNRPVLTPIQEPIPSLPSEYYEETLPAEPPVGPETPITVSDEETTPVEGLMVPEEPLLPVSEVFPAEAPAPEPSTAPEPPVEPSVTEETQ